MKIEVAAKNLRPGDILCTESYPGYKATADENSYMLYSAAYIKMWHRINPENRRMWPDYRTEVQRLSRRVENVSYGPWKARVVTAGGVVVRVPRNRLLSVYRGGESR